ncbi:MAG: hypothetical protein JKX81_18405 [Arenicella sp.]|nr:hypothetical protein [Arenicella sp.]
MKQTSIIFLLTIVTACTPNIHRGQFSLLSTEAIKGDFEVLATSKVNGKACYNPLKTQLLLPDGVFDASVSNALDKVQGATLLLDIMVQDTGPCIVVSGTPARKRR